MKEVYDDISTFYSEKNALTMEEDVDSELVQWLNGYIKQIESLLGIISTCHQSDFEGFHGALEEQEEYYYKYDLYKYARLMPPFTASMNVLEKSDPNTWNDLK